MITFSFGCFALAGRALVGRALVGRLLHGARDDDDAVGGRGPLGLLGVAGREPPLLVGVEREAVAVLGRESTPSLRSERRSLSPVEGRRRALRARSVGVPPSPPPA